VYGLEQALFSICEEGGLDFTDFSQNGRAQPDNLSQLTTDYLLPKQRRGLYGRGFSSGAGERHSPQIPLQKKSLKRSEHNIVTYISAVPQMLFANDAFFQSLTLPEISQLIASKLQKVMFEATGCELDHNRHDISSISQIWQELKIETHRPGWIGFHLSQAGIGHWLTHCINQYDIGIVLHKKQFLMHSACQNHSQVSEALMWQLQYAHARCCCLLHLWHQTCATSTASLTAVQFDSGTESELTKGELTKGELTKSELTEGKLTEGKLIDWPWLETSHEQTQLVHSLVEVSDHMFWIPYQWRSKQYFLLLERATVLCQALERFCAACLTGFPDAFQSEAIASIQKFQARFHLIRIAQKTLETLLKSHLGAEAPTSL